MTAADPVNTIEELAKSMPKDHALIANFAGRWPRQRAGRIVGQARAGREGPGITTISERAKVTKLSLTPDRVHLWAPLNPIYADSE